MYFATGLHYHWRRWLGWVPVQFCMVCGRPYWGGLPRWWVVRGRGLTAEVGMTWQASWKDYCSQKCCDLDGEACDAAMGGNRKSRL